jgi:hypothetical protein
MEDRGIVKMTECGEEAQTIFLERPYEEFQKQTAEQARENAHGQEEIRATTGDPTVAIG